MKTSQYFLPLLFVSLTAAANEDSDPYGVTKMEAEQLKQTVREQGEQIAALQKRVAQLETMMNLVYEANPGLQANVKAKLAELEAAKRLEEDQKKERYRKMVTVAEILEKGGIVKMEDGSFYSAPNRGAAKWKPGIRINWSDKTAQGEKLPDGTYISLSFCDCVCVFPTWHR